LKDVLIAGAGIAGSTLAILLGRAGFSVDLFERSTFPREKPCGEGIMPPGVEVLDRLGVRDAVGGAPFAGVRYLVGGVVAEARFPRMAGRESTGLGQRRLRFDQALFDEAGATRGVSAYAGCAAESVAIEAGRVRGLFVKHELQRARLIVVADGLGSPLRHQLGLDGRPPRRVRAGLRAHFRLPTGSVQPPWVEVYLGRGYEFYVTPLPDGEVLVAALAERAAMRAGADASFAGWLAQQPALSERLNGARRLNAYLGRSPLASPARAGVLPGGVLLGDAAGYLDPITGGGITQALLSAELLANFMPRILSDEEPWLTRFDRERRALLRDYELVTRAVLGISRYEWTSKAAVRLMRASPPLFSHLLGVAAGMRSLWPRSAGGRHLTAGHLSP
jgi:menaquinone-9 beta-reductase